MVAAFSATEVKPILDLPVKLPFYDVARDSRQYPTLKAQGFTVKTRVDELKTPAGRCRSSLLHLRYSKKNYTR